METRVSTEKEELTISNGSRSASLLEDRNEKRTVGAFLLLFLVIVVLRNAWVTEDAYIMFRTIENFVHGYGLTWNITERVQTFTNPLWTLILSGVRLITGELYYTSIAMGTLCTLAAVWLLSFRIARSSQALLFAVVPLILSKAFIDYSTSGLENPFTFLALALFYTVYFSAAPILPGRYLFQLSLITAMALLNRLDTLLLFAPALTVEFFRYQGWRHLGRIFLGFLPFVIWEVFSLVYYGFAFPNTAYAKLNTGVPIAERLAQGCHYMLNSLAWDPITLLTILAGIAVLVTRGRWRGVPLTVGILFYLYYTIRVGGDFMSGRFLAAPLFAAAIGIAAYTPFLLSRVKAVGIVLMVLLFGISNERSPVTSDGDYHLEYVDRNGIADERGYYFPSFGLINSQTDRFPDHSLRDRGEHAGFMADSDPVIVFVNIGVFGYYAGPNVHIVDYFALADPLMARLPAAPGSRIGHFERIIPNGYLNSLIAGENLIAHPDLAIYYDALSIVIKGPIFTWDRFKEIYKINTGQYDHLLRSYKYTRHLIVEPLGDLLKSSVQEQHFAGSWGWHHTGRIWGQGSENHIILHTRDEAVTGNLHLVFDSPAEDQWLRVFLNEKRLAHYEMAPGDTLQAVLPIELEADRQNWITFRYAQWNHPDKPFVPDSEEPLTVRFHKIGIRKAE